MNIEYIFYEKVGDYCGIFQKEEEEKLQEEMKNLKSLVKSVCLENVFLFLMRVSFLMMRFLKKNIAVNIYEYKIR